MDKLIEALRQRIKSPIIDLRYRYIAIENRAEWCVMIDGGAHMRVVRNSHADTPEGALEKAIERWDNRSPEKPF